jgi:hypothetical protein
MVLTRAASRVHRTVRGGTPAGSSRWQKVGGRGGLVAGLGAAGDDEVRVLGALGLVVRKASFEDGPGGGVQRHRLWAVTEPDGASAVDVVQADHPDLDAGGAVQQRQDAQERFVWMDGGIRSPSVKQVSC